MGVCQTQNSMFSTFLASLITLSVCMLTGYAARKAHILNDTINNGMSTLLVRIALPCTVFMSMMRPFTQTLLLESAISFILSSVVYGAVGYGFGFLLVKLFKVGKDDGRLWIFALMFANVGYMGFPITHAVFGDEGMIYASMANASFNILAFTFGVTLFTPDRKAQGKRSIVKLLLKNPALVATIVGLAFFVTGIRLPEPVHNGVAMISGMTTPLSMLLVGSILAKGRLRELFTDVKLLPVMFMRLVGIPAITFFALRPFIPNAVMLGVLVALAAMPVASITVIFAEQYNGNTALASRLVALSTLCCIASVPLISLLLG